MVVTMNLRYVHVHLVKHVNFCQMFVLNTLDPGILHLAFDKV